MHLLYSQSRASRVATRFVFWEHKRALLAEDIDEGRRACIRVNNPPGGRSAGGFW